MNALVASTNRGSIPPPIVMIFTSRITPLLISVTSIFGLGVNQAAVTVTNLTNTIYDGEAPDKVSDLAGNQYRGGYINGSLFVEGSVGSGSGVFRDVFRLQGAPQNSSQSGYNRPSGGVYDESFLGGNTPLRFTEMQKDSTGAYYIFVVDVNEGGNTANGLISLDQFQVWVKPETAGAADPFPSANPSDLTSGPDLATELGIPAYALNQIGQENVVFLDASIQAGSGNSDLNIYIPIALIDAQITDFNTDYVFVQAKMGAYAGTTNFRHNSGHDSVSVPQNLVFTPQTAIPEPSGFLLLISGLCLLGSRRSR